MFSSDVGDHLRRYGWCRIGLDPDDSIMLDLDSLRRQCAHSFMRTMESSAPHREATPSGQYGYTADGDEGGVGLREVRSHLVFNQSVPPAHPLAPLSPLFYGEDFDLGEFAPIAPIARRLHEILDLLTMEMVELIEDDLGLEFGEIAGQLAMGERLFRLQWYPSLPAGQVAAFSVHRGEKAARVVGIAEPGLASQLVRVSPHKDIGHWTWQVYATDSQLRFQDPLSGETLAAPTGQWMYGNVCEFLEDDHPRLRAPTHWVDLGDGTELRDRISISYFAHVRPTVMVGDLPSGLKLYARLASLGYVSTDECRVAEGLLAEDNHVDARVIERVVDWERTSGGPPQGFAVGLSRYFDRDGNGGIHRRSKEDAGPIRSL